MTNKQVLSVCLCLLLLPFQGCAEAGLKEKGAFVGRSKSPGMAEPQPAVGTLKISVSRKSELEYILYHPRFKREKQYRMILALHGAQEQASHYMEIWRKAALEHETIIVTPQLDAGLFLFNSNQDPTLFFELVNSLKSRYPIDETRIYIAGASLGAATGTFLIQHRPRFWRGAIFVASIGFSDCFPGRSIESVTNYQDFPPILYVMGLQDTVNFGAVQEGVKFLLGHGVRVDSYDYESAGHEHRSEWNERIFEWIENVEKGQQPVSDRRGDKLAAVG